MKQQLDQTIPARSRSCRQLVRLIAGTAAFLLLPLHSVNAATAEGKSQQAPTFSNEVVRILQQNCQQHTDEQSFHSSTWGILRE